MSDNIRISTEYNDDVIALWQDAFGDSREDVEYFLTNCRHKSIIGYYDKNRLASMLFFVDCKICSEKYKYIYAACTDKKYRSHGFMTELLDYAKQMSDRIVLVPADNSLVGFYNGRGFETRISVNDIVFDEIDEIKEYLLEGCELETPFAIGYIGD